MEVRAGADVNGGGGSGTKKILVPGIDEWVVVTGLSDGFAEKSPVFGSDGYVHVLVLEEFLAEKAQRTTSRENFRVDLISWTLSGGEGRVWPRDL